VQIINSAIFHSGFLVGSDYYDYKVITPATPSNQALFQWREDFFRLCQNFGIKPAAACVQFALKVPGVSGVALNTTSKEGVKETMDLAGVAIPVEFWKTMKAKRLIRDDYPYV
jgi:D-threo-aldose 1-dehydrogenase